LLRIIELCVIITQSLTAECNWLWVAAPSKLADPQQQPMCRQQWVWCPAQSGSSR